MVYAVASETLQRFEAALGRQVHWRQIPHTPDTTTEQRAAASRCLNLFSARDVSGQYVLQSRGARHRVRL
jgi:hypothetical protein